MEKNQITPLICYLKKQNREATKKKMKALSLARLLILDVLKSA